jgi:transcriptional regulator with XRE-family HTH domain
MVKRKLYMGELQCGSAPNNPGAMIQPAQLRAARALVGWSREKLAKSSGVPAPTIRDFELNKTDPKQGTVHKWRRTLEDAGVEFLDEDPTKGAGVRLRTPADGRGQAKR